MFCVFVWKKSFGYAGFLYVICTSCGAELGSAYTSKKSEKVSDEDILGDEMNSQGDIDPSEDASRLRNSMEGVGERGFGEFGVGDIGDDDVLLVVC